MLLALIGVLVMKIGGNSEWVWRAASGAGLLFVATIGTAALRREKLRRNLPGFRKIASFVMFAMVATAFVGFACVAAGVAGDYGFHVYTAMLYLFLVICCTMFVFVIASLTIPTKVSGSGPAS